MRTICGRAIVSRQWTAVLATGLLWGAVGFAQTSAAQSSAPDSSNSAPKSSDSNKQDDKPASGTARIRIQVNDGNDKAVANASVYVRYYTAGGFLHREKLAEMDFKTNQDGSVKVPEVPQGKVLIQVIAKGWHTFGKWYDIEKDEESVAIKLEPPPHWY